MGHFSDLDAEGGDHDRIVRSSRTQMLRDSAGENWQRDWHWSSRDMTTRSTEARRENCLTLWRQRNSGTMSSSENLESVFRGVAGRLVVGTSTAERRGETAKAGEQELTGYPGTRDFLAAQAQPTVEEDTSGAPMGSSGDAGGQRTGVQGPHSGRSETVQRRLTWDEELAWSNGGSVS